MPPSSPDYDRTAALLVDFQEDYRRPQGTIPAPDYEAAVAHAADVVHACRRHGVPVIHSTFQVDPSGIDGMVHGPFGTGRQPRVGVAGTPGAAICRELAPADGEPVVARQRFSAFHNTRLDNILHRLGVDHLILMGVLTHGCIAATAYGAQDRDYRVTLVKDACASWNAASHRCAVLLLAGQLYGGAIASADQLIRAIGGEAAHISRHDELALPRLDPLRLDDIYDAL